MARPVQGDNCREKPSGEACLILDITRGRGWTEREIGYNADFTLDIRGKVAPDIVGDFNHLPFRSNCADLIVCDPPHQVYGFGRKQSFVDNYGSFRNLEESATSLRQALSECNRVLKPKGSLLLKWSTNHRPLEWVLSLTDMKARILTARPSLSSQPKKPFSHKARVYWVELGKRIWPDGESSNV